MLLGGQTSQTARPGTGAIVAGSQGTHIEAPARGCADPRGQTVHVLVPGKDEALPAPQAVQAAAPVHPFVLLPGSHGRHDDREAPPGFADAVPAGQFVHPLPEK